MNRLFRHNRRKNASQISIPSQQKQKAAPIVPLNVEHLEPRVMLTTLTLHSPDEFGQGGESQLLFYYSDPETTEFGDANITDWNVLTIGTLTGLAPATDVVVEILDYAGGDIGGIATGYTGNALGGVLFFGDILFDGPNGMYNLPIQSVPIDTTGVLDKEIHALASSPLGDTYGLDSDGVLYEIDIDDGTATTLGAIWDTDNPAADGNIITDFSNFQSAAYLDGLIYAVVTGPIGFDEDGESLGSGPVLIAIDPSPQVDPIGGGNYVEAEAVGRNFDGEAYYDNSVINMPNGVNITTIVTSEDPLVNDGNADTIEFLGFNAISLVYEGEEEVTNSFVVISAQPGGGDSMIVSAADIYTFEDEVYIDGLFYDNDGFLWGLSNEYEEGAATGGSLVLIPSLTPVEGEEMLLEYVAYGTDADGNQIVLTGATYDPDSGYGYATDPNSLTLYKINTQLTPMGDICIMYIASSTPDVYITLTYATLDSEGNFHYLPQGGDPAFLYTDEDDSDLTTPENAGGAMIGTLPYPVDEDIIWGAEYVFTSPGGYLTDIDELGNGVPFSAHGAWPGGYLRPGIQLANVSENYGYGNVGDPQSIGIIQIGGGVFGDVTINGSIGMFYAGYLGTNSFEVKGDLDNIIVNTQAGGIVESDGVWTPTGYLTMFPVDPILEVWGEMGGFYSNGVESHWGLPISVLGRADAPSFPGLLDVSLFPLDIFGNPIVDDNPDNDVYIDGVMEIERKVSNQNHSSQFLFGGFDEEGGSWVLTNDTPFSAQYVGSVDGNISIFGCNELNPNNVIDSLDYYSFGVMAGQTLTIEASITDLLSNYIPTLSPIPAYPFYLTDNTSIVYYGGSLALFDPNHELVETYLAVDLLTPFGIQPLEFTAEIAGVYTLEVSSGGWAYRVDISGTSPMTLAGGNIMGEMRHMTGLNNISVAAGNCGAISVGGTARNIVVKINNGDLAAFRVGANGLPVGDLVISGIGSSEEGPDFGYSMEWDDNGNSIGNNIIKVSNVDISVINVIYASGNIGQISSTATSVLDIIADGYVQSVWMGSEVMATQGENDDEENIVEWTGGIAAGYDIGEINVNGNYGPAIAQEDGSNSVGGGIPGFYANYDGLGKPGVIDVIKISGDFGSSNGASAELVVSVGSAGGNVRFVDIGGGISMETNGFGGDFGPFEFSPGQSVVLTDDSGAQIRISPGHSGEDVEDFLFGATPPADFNLPREGDGGVLTLKLLPIRDQLLSEYNGDTNQKVLGYAIVDITSTDGLRITTTGGPAEIGVATVQGRVDHSVVFSGPSPISILRLETSAPVLEDETTDTQQGDEEEGELPDTGISRIINSTLGDIVSMVIAGENTPNVTVSADSVDYTVTIVEDPLGLLVVPEVELVSVRGNLGTTYSSTGQVVFGPIINPVVEVGNQLSVAADPGGTQRNGLLSSTNIVSIQAYNALGDVDVRGDVGSIIINADNSRKPGVFEGVAGPIIIYGHLDYINLGDGVPEPGTGRWAEAGVFVVGILDRVFISGPGREISGPIFAVEEMNYVSVKNGAVLTGYNYYPSTGERVDSALASAPTLAVTLDLEAFTPVSTAITFLSAGDIGFVDVSGAGSSISGATLLGENINLVQVGGGADGIFDSRFYAIRTNTANTGKVGQILVTNGDFHDNVVVTDREISNIRITGGDIQDSEFRSDIIIGKISADAISRTDIDAGNKLDSVTVKGSIFDLAIEAGELGTLTAQGILPATGSQSRGSITGSGIYVSGAVGKIQTKGDLISTIHVTGWDGDLKNLQVGGDLGTPTGGEIIVDGRIGNISVGGDFLAELLINWDPSPVSPANPQGPHEKYDPAYYGRLPGPSIQMMRVGGDILGIADIGGDVSMIMCGGDFGTFGETFHVHGNLGMMMIGMGSPGGGNLESSLVVDGNAPMVFVFGDVNGKIDVTENFGTLLLLARGAGNRADLNGSITVGGNFTTLIIIGGDIAQTDVVDGEPLQITVAGKGPRTIVIGSDLSGIDIFDGVDDKSYDGSLTTGAAIISTDDVRRIRFGEDIQEGSRIVIDGDLDELLVEGSISGQIHVTGNLGKLTTTNVTSTAVVTAGGDIGFINVSGTVGSGTCILAGYNPGVDLATLTDGVFTATELTVDGTDVDPNEQAYAANITSVNIGLLWNSVVAAGVHPGNNNLFGDMDGSDYPADGMSTIGSVILREVQGDFQANPAPFGVFADTAIKSLRIGTRTYIPPSGTITLANGFRALEVGDTAIGDGGVVFQQGLPFNGTINGVGVSVMLIGPGTGEIVPGNTTIESITLTNTTLATMLIVRANGNATIDVEELITADDAALGTLMLDNSAAGAAMEMTIGGGMNRLQLNGVAPGSDIQINGKLGSGDLGVVRGTAAAPTTITVAGDTPRLQTVSATDNVTIVADNVGQLMSRGDFDAVLNAAGINGVLTSAIVMGDMGGVLAAVDDIGRIMVMGTTSGAISAGGDLQYLMTRGLYRAVVTAAGNLKQVQVLGDVEFSTLAGGLAIGLDGELFNDDDDEITALRGDVERVWIMGDFIQSNVAAGVAPGADLFFGTDDDILQSRVVENMDAPTIIDVYFPDEFSIAVTFKDVAQRESSNIKSVTITGEIEGSSSPLDTFAFIASGKVQSVFFNRQAFSGEENVLRSEISLKGISPTSIVNDDIDSLAEALAAAFRVQTDGLDNLFDTADDIYLYGDDDADTDPTVYVTFDEATNTAVFHKTDGVAFNVWGTNYYRITLDAAQIVNRQGVPLDGEFLGISDKGDLLPTGDGVPGGDFIFTFAVSDIGGSPLTAFDPFGGADFSVGPTWYYSTNLGDDISVPSVSRDGGDIDFYRLNNLSEGDLFISELINYTGYCEMYLFPDAALSLPETVLLTEEDVVFDDLLQELTVASYNSSFPFVTLDSDYNALGYSAMPDDNADGIEEGIFYLVDITTPDGAIAPLMIDNPDPDPDPGDPEEVPLSTEILSYIYNTTVDNTIEIRAVKALEFGAYDKDLGIDELWLIVTVYDDDSGEERDSLMRIGDIINYASADTTKELSAVDLAAHGFTDVTSLAFNKPENINVASVGQLFALDRDTQTLLTLNRDVENVEDFGAAYAFGGHIGNLQQADRADYDVVSIDFDLSGQLYGIENNLDVMVWIYTDIILTEGFAPLGLIKQLPESEYAGATFGLLSLEEDMYVEMLFMTMTTEDLAAVQYVSTSPLEGLTAELAASPDENSNHPEGYLDEIISADGDYLLAIVGYGGSSFAYNLKVEIFNDGNSDFGNDVVTTYGPYTPLYANSVPVNLNDLDELNEDTYPSLSFNTITIDGDNLTIGQEDSLIINAALEVRDDIDVYAVRLQQGQKLTVDIEAETLFGGDTVALDVGIYNADLEATASIGNLVGGEDVLPAAQSPDPVYTIQAIYHMPDHEDVIIDPMENDPMVDDLVGTYYIVVTGASSHGNYHTPYRLIISTTNPEPIITPPSQLVYLAFDGGIAEYLSDPEMFTSLDIIRPPFNLADFRLEELDRTAFINSIVARVIEIYREAGLTEDEIVFTTNRQVANASDIYSTVYIGGRAPSYGLLGIADSIDRHNANRDGNACTFSQSYAELFSQVFNDNVMGRAVEVRNMMANNIAHELGHTLGLEHCTEVVEMEEPNNIMNYNSTAVRMGDQEFSEQNRYWYQPIGYINEVDILLRSIGSGTEMGY